MNSPLLRNLSVFLVGLTLFMFEITLTRLFSTLMWYHFVFMAISLAMLGSTIGGVYAFKWLNTLQEEDKEQISKRKNKLLTALASSLLLSIVIPYKVPYNDVLFLAYIVLSTIPFILGGYYMALVMKEGAQKSNAIYFADLLGSAIGSLLIVILLNNYSLIRIGVILALIPLVIYAYSLPRKTHAFLSCSSVVLILAVVILGGGFLDNMAKDFGAYKGNPKTLAAFSTNSRIVFTSWNSLARTDVVEEPHNKHKTVLVDGGASSKMIPFNGDLKSIDYLKKNVGYFPFAYKDNKSALLIGPGGGEDLLYARLAGVTDITAVELNPGTVAAARHFKDFNGDIYDQQGTKTYIEDGRSFITRDKNKYDVIFLSKVMTQASETLGYALSENYIYTKEAYESYLDHLNPGGTLAFVLHGENDLIKATATLLSIFEERGISRENAAKYMVIANSEFLNGKSHKHVVKKVMSPLLMVKNIPFTEGESNKILELTLASGQTLLNLPGRHERISVIAPPAHTQPLFTVTDDYPFFYNAGRTAPTVIFFILIIIVLAGHSLLKPIISVKDQSIRFFRNYFAYIGLAFMLIEIPLIQKLVLLFGHPTLTFSVVIAILLFSVGIGSLISKVIAKHLPLKAVGTLIFIYTGLLYLYLPKFIIAFQGNVLSVKIVATLGLMLPLGILMGIPFPTGIRMIEQQHKPDYIPLLWGVNGWTSVIGSILSLVIAMSLGYNATLLIGATIYLAFAYLTRKTIFS